MSRVNLYHNTSLQVREGLGNWAEPMVNITLMKNWISVALKELQRSHYFFKNNIFP